MLQALVLINRQQVMTHNTWLIKQMSQVLTISNHD